MTAPHPASDQRPAGRPIALITGASAGIGEAFALELARRGFDLVLVARRRERLAVVAAKAAPLGARSELVVADLGEPGAGTRVAEEAVRLAGRVDCLVNNAGYGLATTFCTTPWEEELRFLNVLLVSGVELTHRLLPAMRERRSGRLIHVSSVSAWAPETPGSLYFAVKRHLNSFSRALSAELAGSGVTSTAVCPGFTYSEFHDVMGNREHMRKLPGWMWMDAATVARLGVDAAWRGDEVYIPGLVNKAIAAICHCVPRPILHLLAPRDLMDRHQHARPGPPD